MKSINKDRLRIFSQVLFLLVFIILLRNRILQGWIVVFAGAAILSLIYSRFYCGWICPAGTILRFESWIYHKLGLKRLNPPQFIKTKGLRWIWLVLFVVLLLAVKVLELRVNVLLYLTLLAAFISLFFIEEFWHKYVCPFGSILSIKRNSRYKLQISRNDCNSCGACQRVCPNNVITKLADTKRDINSRDCLLCFKCQEKCPTDAIHYSSIKY